MHHGDPHACSIDFVGRFQWLAGAADIAIVDLHEDVAEGEVLGAGGIATSKPDVPFVLAEAFYVPSWILIWDQTN